MKGPYARGMAKSEETSQDVPGNDVGLGNICTIRVEHG
jgi:hypothetical protein